MAARKKALVTWADGSTDATQDNYKEVNKNDANYLAAEQYDHALSQIEEAEDVNPFFTGPAIQHPSGPQIIMAEAVATLTEQQRKVWHLCMQMEKSQTDTAKILKLTQQTVDQHLKAATKKVTAYCKENAYRLGDSEEDIL